MAMITQADLQKMLKLPWQWWQGECYEAALLYALTHPDAVLVHGWIRRPNGARWFCHAWCELDDVVHDLTMPHKSECIEEYYKSRRVLHTTEYSYDEAVENMTTLGHAGRWDDLDEATEALIEQGCC